MSAPSLPTPSGTEFAEPIEVPTPMYEPTHEPLNDGEVNYVYGDEEVRGSGNEPIESDNGDKGYNSGSAAPILTIIGVALFGIAFVLTVVATPLDVFRARADNTFLGDTTFRACYSLWGYKKCGAHSTAKHFTMGTTLINLPEDGWLCSEHKNVMRAAASFSIISVFFTLVALIVGALALMEVLSGALAGVCGVFAMTMLLICWACTAGTYHKSCNLRSFTSGFVSLSGVHSTKREYRFGAGMGVMVAAWCLEVIGAVLFFLV